VKCVPNSNNLEAKFTIHNTTAYLLHNDCQQVMGNIKREELHFFYQNQLNKVDSGRNWQNLFLPKLFEPIYSVV